MTKVTRFCNGGRLALLALVFAAVFGCKAETAMPTSTSTSVPSITPTNYKITFPGVSYDDVLFDHKHHSSSSDHGIDGDCYACHNCSDFFGETRWNCRECHSAKDPEGLCQEDQLHGCVMAQCKLCHDRERAAGQGKEPPLDSDCELCHTQGPLPVYTFTGVITASNEVDQHVFSLNLPSTTATVIIDVEAYEGCGGKWSAEFFGNGETNDRLLANVFLFRSNGSYLGSATGPEPGQGYTEGTPHVDRSAYNAYIKVPGLASGDYMVALGAANMSRSDALLGSNSGGASWYSYDTSKWPDRSYNNYRIKVYTRLD